MKIVSFFMSGERTDKATGMEFLDLNDDSIYAILRYVPRNDLVSIAQTSARLKAIAEQKFKRKLTIICHNATDATATRKLLQMFGARLVQLNIDFHSCSNASRIMDAVFRYCSSSLGSLTLKSFEIPDQQEAFDGLARIFKNLHTLHMENVTIEGIGVLDTLITPKNGNLINFFVDCELLANLTLIEGYDFRRAIFENWFPKLEHYADTTDEEMTVDTSLQGFILRHRNLKSFSVVCKQSYNFDWWLPVLKILATNCQQLEKIAFGIGPFNDPTPCLALHNVFRLPNLKEIKMFSFQSEHVSKELHRLSNKLEILDVEFCGGNAGVIPAISQLRMLRFLRLYEVADGELEDINALGELTNLETLVIELYENPKFDLLGMVSRLVKLTKLKFHVGNFKIGYQTYRRLSSIVQGRPDVRNRQLHLDCPRADDFNDSELVTPQTVKFISLQ